MKHTPLPQRIGHSLVLAVSLMFLTVLAGTPSAWADLPLLPGQAITTHFSGIENNTSQPFLQGKVLSVLDIRDPVANSAPFALPGPTNWTVPRYQHTSWDATTLGEVFGLALDTSKAQPDIYLASSSSMYFRDTAFNMTPGSLANGYGGVFKIDGVSGAASLLANLPSATFNNGFTRYAGLAQIAANPTGRTLYVANYEDGKIYVLNMDTGATVETFDHGTQAASPTIADDGTAGFTQLGRRVSAVQYHPQEQRLYYSVWAVDGNKIWSVPVASNGATNGAARFELSYTSGAWAGSSNAVITDIAFSKDGQRMLAGEMPVVDGSYMRSSHYTSGVEWVGSGGGWTLNNSLEGGNGTIPVGLFNNKINAAGSVAYGYNNYGTNAGASEPCEDSFVLMGDALYFPAPFIYGLQITPLTGSTTATLGQDDYIVDLENSTGGNENNDKSGLGDVEVLSGCVPPVTPKGNLTISKAVAGGTDPQTFNIQLDCSDNSFDNNAITLTAGATHTVSNIPAGTTCTVTETTPSAPSGYSYSAPVITPAQPVTIVANSTVAVSVLNQMTAKMADIEVNKVVDKPKVNSGDVVTYTITVKNNGPDNATGIEVTDQLPSGVTYKPTYNASQGTYSSATGIWSVGSLTNGTTATLTIQATVN